MDLTNTLLALLPFALLFFFIIIRNWSALKAMPLVWIVTVLIGLIIWKISPVLIAASFVKGIFVTVEIILIIFGATWVIELLKEKKQMNNIHSLLSVVSEDARVQAIVIAFFFGGLIEGVAGFGTPAALAAPLLVSLGFSPILSVVVSLIGNSTSVSFGGAGTPVLLGLGGLGFGRDTLLAITQNVAIFHVVGSFIVPLAISWFVISYSNEKDKKRHFISIIPFAIFSWALFCVPYYLIAKFVGPELPTIIAGLFGLIVISIVAHYDFLVPKKKIIFGKKSQRKVKKFSVKNVISFAPYLLIVVFLTLSRTVPLLRNFLVSFKISYIDIFGSGASYEFLPLFTPSFYFFVSGLIVVGIFRANQKEVLKSLDKTFKKIYLPAITLIFTLGLVQLFLVSGINNSGLESMPLVLAKSVGEIFGKGFVIFSPFVGVFGAFIAGSNTVSNLLFGAFQNDAAQTLG
ncbi:MAG: L-lactate permease, partial [Nanoarchaeota archaeon]|nr:L-lactate permease [Nanoarchaeota archaeon]